MTLARMVNSSQDNTCLIGPACFWLSHVPMPVGSLIYTLTPSVKNSPPFAWRREDLRIFRMGVYLLKIKKNILNPFEFQSNMSPVSGGRTSISFHRRVLSLTRVLNHSLSPLSDQAYYFHLGFCVFSVASQTPFQDTWVFPLTHKVLWPWTKWPLLHQSTSHSGARQRRPASTASSPCFLTFRCSDRWHHSGGNGAFASRSTLEMINGKTERLQLQWRPLGVIWTFVPHGSGTFCDK